MGKKNLEQLFKDTFQDFQELPDERVWNSIEATLDKKKQKKRVIPIWWQLGGVAALFAILFFAINSPLENGENQNTNIPNKVSVTDSEDTELLQEDIPEETIEVTDVQSDPTRIDKVKEPSSGKNKEAATDSYAASNESYQSQRTPQKQNPDNGMPKNVPNTVLAQNNGISQDIKTEIPKKRADVLENKGEDAMAIASNEEGNTKESEKKMNNSIPSQESVTKNTGLENSAVAKVDVTNSDDETESQGKKSIYDAIAEQNSIEEEDVILAENTSNKWAVGPSVAPVYFSGSGEGSPIHSNFSTNSKSGNVNLSYGLTVTYNLGKKLKVRSGVHRVDYGYDTNEIVFSSSLEGSTNELIDNINYSETSRNLVVQSSKRLPDEVTADSFSEIRSAENPARDGKMVQQLGYIEVPLELNYALIDKKFGVDIIGGISSLFLVDNTILLESLDEALVTEVGEANNANSVNFSTNVGVGFNYEISPKVQLNLEPVFKYQLNTFSETAGPFRPFSVGVYSGVSFKF